MTSTAARPLIRFATLSGAAGLALVACGGDAAQSGETLIETEIEEQIGLGELEASCDQPEGAETGTEFTCTATTDDGRLIEFLAVFTSEDEIFVQPTNLLSADQVAIIEQNAADLLSPELPVDLDPALMDCPSDDVVFIETVGGTEEGVLDCTYPDPETGEPVPLRMTLTGFDPEQGWTDLFAAIGDAVDG